MPKESKQQRRERFEAALEKLDFPNDSLSVVKMAFHNFSGDFTVLESAVGAYFLGMMVGWRPLLIIHSPRTIKRYEGILSIKFIDAMPDKTEFSERSRGYEAALLISNFWAGVSGNTSVENRKIDIGLDGQMNKA
jgi:hypothetical protein